MEKHRIRHRLLSVVLCITMILTLGAIFPPGAASAFSTNPMISAEYGSKALKSDGTVWAWGSNHSDRLGIEYTEGDYRTTPVRIQNLNNVRAISGSVALLNDGTVWVWGRNAEGITTTNYHIPVQVQHLTNITAIASGGSYTVALRSDGTVWTWGANNFGQLGDGTRVNRSTPVQVQNLTNVTAISAGGNHTVALRNDGTVWIWGDKSMDKSGNCSIDRENPTQIQNLTNVTAIAAAWNHTIALRSDGTVWAWTPHWEDYIPEQVQGLANVTAISAGVSHSLALRSDGTVWAWGAIWHETDIGHLSDTITIPVQVQSLTDVTAISAGSALAMALRNDNSVWAWGWNAQGNLGDGTSINRHSPVQVLGPDGVGFLNLGVGSVVPPPHTHPTTPINVFLNDVPLTFDVPPQIMDGRTLVPLRAIFEALGAEVDWNSATQTVIANRANTEIILTIGDSSPTINGQVVSIDQPGVIIDGRTLVPLRFVGEALGADVNWDQNTRTVNITN